MAAMRADPKLSRVLDSPRLAAALAAIRADPSALARFSNDPEVMAVLSRLLEADLGSEQAAQFADLGTSPQGLLSAVAEDPALAAALSAPRVRAALAEIRADPVGGMARWAGDAQVMAALDQLEAALGPRGAGAGGVVDVQAAPGPRT